MKLANRDQIIQGYLDLLYDNLISCTDAELIDIIETHMMEPWENIEGRWFNT
jgi:hypothetical protein